VVWCLPFTIRPVTLAVSIKTV